MLEASDNRFEQWFSGGRYGRFVLLLTLVLVWLMCDSLIAVAFVASGYSTRDTFFVTSLWSSRTADHRGVAGVSEMLARKPHIYPNYMDRFQFDGLLGASLVPNFLTITPPLSVTGKELANGIDKTFWFMTDEQGFPPVARIDHPYAKEKPRGVFRIIMLGGSTVEGNGVNTPFDSLPSKLQLLLERRFVHSSQLIEVINGGISNFASDQEYLHLIADLLLFHPDLVIAYDGWNDSEVLPVTLAGAPRTRPYRSVSQQDNGDRLNETFSAGGALAWSVAQTAGTVVGFLNHFATFRFVSHGTRRLINPLLAKHAPSPVPGGYRPALSVEAARIYIENHERMMFLAKQQGFRLASFLQPVMGVDGKAYTDVERQRSSHMNSKLPDPVAREERDVFYRTVRPLLRGFAEANEVAGSLCAADVSETSFANVSDTVYADSGHLLANGNELVAERILAELERCQLLPSK